MKKLVSETQLTESVPFSVKTLRKWRSLTNSGLANPGPAFVRIGRRVFYDVEVVEAWLASGIVGAE